MKISLASKWFLEQTTILSRRRNALQWAYLGHREQRATDWCGDFVWSNRPAFGLFSSTQKFDISGAHASFMVSFYRSHPSHNLSTQSRFLVRLVETRENYRAPQLYSKYFIFLGQVLFSVMSLLLCYCRRFIPIPFEIFSSFKIYYYYC